MVAQGFILETDVKTSNKSGYSLPAGWNNSSSAWTLRYTHDAYENEFMLEASRQESQLLVRLIEVPGEVMQPGQAFNVQVSADCPSGAVMPRRTLAIAGARAQH